MRHSIPALNAATCSTCVVGSSSQVANITGTMMNPPMRGTGCVCSERWLGWSCATRLAKPDASMAERPMAVIKNASAGTQSAVNGKEVSSGNNNWWVSAGQ